jgi:hypothetical protein
MPSHSNRAFHSLPNLTSVLQDGFRRNLIWKFCTKRCQVHVGQLHEARVEMYPVDSKGS